MLLKIVASKEDSSKDPTNDETSEKATKYPEEEDLEDANHKEQDANRTEPDEEVSLETDQTPTITELDLIKEFIKPEEYERDERLGRMLKEMGEAIGLDQEEERRMYAILTSSSQDDNPASEEMTSEREEVTIELYGNEDSSLTVTEFYGEEKAQEDVKKQEYSWKRFNDKLDEIAATRKEWPLSDEELEEQMKTFDKECEEIDRSNRKKAEQEERKVFVEASNFLVFGDVYLVMLMNLFALFTGQCFPLRLASKRHRFHLSTHPRKRRSVLQKHGRLQVHRSHSHLGPAGQRRRNRSVRKERRCQPSQRP